jgi:hypothetical protein
MRQKKERLGGALPVCVSQLKRGFYGPFLLPFIEYLFGEAEFVV